MRPIVFAAAAALAVALAGCNASAPSPAAEAAAPSSGGSPYTPSGFALAKGSSCGATVARWREVVGNDVHIGYLTAGQGKGIDGEIGAADAQCKAGHDAQARSMIAASRARHGYPADSGG